MGKAGLKSERGAFRRLCRIGLTPRIWTDIDAISTVSCGGVAFSVKKPAGLTFARPTPVPKFDTEHDAGGADFIPDPTCARPIPDKSSSYAQTVAELADHLLQGHNIIGWRICLNYKHVYCILSSSLSLSVCV